MIDTVEERIEKDKQSVLNALKEMPIVQVACKRAGISRATYYRWRNEDTKFASQSEDALGEGIEIINDMSESQLVTLIREKKMPAISMWLKHNHARFSTKKIPPRKSHATPPPLSPEEKAIMQKALKLASGGSLTKHHGHRSSKRRR